MNKWNRLLAMLDQVYGFADKQHSEYRKVGQHYDERTNEHAVIIEYRVRRGTKLDQGNMEIPESASNSWKLIREIHQMTEK